MRRRPQGFSLVELMIAIALGLLVLLVLSRLMAQQNGARAEIEKSGRQIENGRYAMSLLQDDVQLAGYYGQNGGSPALLASLPNPCELGATVASRDAIAIALALPIQGYDEPATLPAALAGCLAEANHLDGTDIIVLRRSAADNTVTGIADAVAGRVYLQATPAAMVVGTGGATAAATFTLLRKDGSTPAELRRYVERIYFVSPCHLPTSGTVCDEAADGGQPIPTLKRLELTEAGFTITPLVEGIENLQLEYGIDDNADGAPDSYESAPSVARFSDVMAVRIGLLARTIEPSAGQVDRRSYQLGDALFDGPGDAYKRQAYSVAVRAVNLSGRRE